MAAERASFVNLFAVEGDGGHAELGRVVPVDAMPKWPISDGWPVESPVMAEFHDKNGTLLLRQGLGRQAVCLHPIPGRDPARETRVIAGIVRVPPDAARLKIVDASGTLAEHKLPTRGPALDFSWAPTPASTVGRQHVAWTGSHPDQVPVTYTLCVVREDGVWQPLALPSEATKVDVDFDDLPGGHVAFGVISTDGFHVAKAVSPTFQLPLKPCQPLILSPMDGEKVGEHVRLHGVGHYRETAVAERHWLFWSDDLQGDLGLGEQLEVRLPPGQHRITLRAGSPGRDSAVQITLIVG